MLNSHPFVPTADVVLVLQGLFRGIRQYDCTPAGSRMHCSPTSHGVLPATQILATPRVFVGGSLVLFEALEFPFVGFAALTPDPGLPTLPLAAVFPPDVFPLPADPPDAPEP